MGSGGSRSLDYETIRARFETQGQDHVFRFWSQLDARERERLLAQTARVDLPALLAGLAAARAAEPGTTGRLAPVPVERSAAHGGDAARIERARQRGEALLREGRVGVLVVAGGQATRLGFDGPKGAFPLGPLTGRSLFEIQAQKLRRARERCGRAIPWYVMTSDATDAPTREFFQRHACFGLPEEDLFFFRQGMVPSFDLQDRLVLAAPGRLMENPDGHGGALTALLSSGALDDMDRRGITTLFYYQVDNPLVRMADPAFLGFHAEAGAEVSCKVVRKTDPMEKVGIVARVGDAVGVVEYTELDDEHRHARDAQGELVYWTGNVAIHVFETAFVRRIAKEADRWLPFHASLKKIPTIDDAGRPLEPSEPNGRKLERFVFDALPAARSVCVVEAERAEEFSPVKNASGSDSPETARRDLIACYRRWLEAADVRVPADATVEVDHACIDSREDAIRLGAARIAEVRDAVRIASGAHP